MAELFFSYRANSSDPNWEVLNYLNKLELEESRNRVLESVFCFWYALAVEKEGKDWSLAVRESNGNIYQLERRMSLLEEEFELSEDLLRACPSKKLFHREERSSINFEFRYQTRGEGEGQDWLFRYLRAKDTSFTIDQKLLWALDAYWGAIAYQETEPNEEKVMAKALSCWHYLRKHKEFLEKTFLGYLSAYPRIRQFKTENPPNLVRNRTLTLSDANEERILEREEIQKCQTNMDSLQNNRQVMEPIDHPKKAVHICQEFPSELDINSDEFIENMINHPMNSVMDEFNKQDIKNSF